MQKMPSIHSSAAYLLFVAKTLFRVLPNRLIANIKEALVHLKLNKRILKLTKSNCLKKAVASPVYKSLEGSACFTDHTL